MIRSRDVLRRLQETSIQPRGERLIDLPGESASGGVDGWFLVAVTTGSYDDARYECVEQMLQRESGGLVTLVTKPSGRSGVCWNTPEIVAGTHNLVGEGDTVYTWARSMTPSSAGGTTTEEPTSTPPGSTEPGGSATGIVYLIDVPIGDDGGDWVEVYWLDVEQITDDGCECVARWKRVRIKMQILAEEDPPTCTEEAPTTEAPS